MIYPVVEIFQSIQGEGRHMGRPANFIRLAGCNLKCSWCFGIVKGRHVPRLHAVFGDGETARIRIDKAKVGTKLLTFDTNQNIVETTITETLKREVLQYYEIVLGTTTYYVTPEHPFFTTSGMVTAAELKIGDMVLHSTGGEVQSYRKTVYNPMFNPETVLKTHSKIDYADTARKISNTIRLKKKKGTYACSYSTLTEEKKAELRLKSSLNKLGPKNPRYLVDYPYRNLNRLQEEVKTNPERYSCAVCGKEGTETKIFIHHADANPTNDLPSNLCPVCSHCHNIIHKRGYNFWASDRRDGKQMLVKTSQHNGIEVMSKKYVDISEHPFYGRSYGPHPLSVYNISCAPYNTYLLDYMWVHNCDTKQSWEVVDKQKLNAREIIDRLSPQIEYVIITGGEPLIHNLTRLVRTLKAFGYIIAIETNGTIEIPKDIRDEIDWVTVSPKEQSGFTIMPEPDELKYIVDDSFNISILRDVKYSCPIYLNPESARPDMMKKAYELVMAYPELRLGIQMHKVFEVR